MKALFVLALVAAAPAASQTPDDRHLPVIPRTAAEATQVASLAAQIGPTAAPDPGEDRSAGTATVPRLATADAFSAPSAGLGAQGAADFRLGQRLFRKIWVAAPAPTAGSDGLGPLYNARSCHDCHRKDGRGLQSQDGGPATGLFLRVSLPGGDAPADIADWIATQPHPAYGAQIQDRAAPGQVPEARISVTWSETPVTLAGGEVVVLRRPTHALADPGFGPTGPDTLFSPRLAPPMIGLGLLEAIPAADILALADPDDADGDSISGRANVVPSVEHGVPMLGRFGWKAEAPSVKEQSAGALSRDMGLSNPLHSAPAGDCTDLQTACLDGPHGQEAGLRDGLEVSSRDLDLITFYARNLGVPARTSADDPRVLRGKALFHRAQCAACHVPAHVTHRLAGEPALSFQLIRPWTDLLLHDMGPGLADNSPAGRATGSEWRTPPLWGIGLTAQVAGTAAFLHDGRAGTLIEAILWHGGEAQAARDAVAAMAKNDRAALLAFLESL